MNSTESQAFRVKAAEVAEPPLCQSKACYLETRGLPSVIPFYRVLLEGDAWNLMGKQPSQLLTLWQRRYAEEVADSMLPKTVPPYSSRLVWAMTGNAVAQWMAALGAGELHARWKRVKELLDSGSNKFVNKLPQDPGCLYAAATLQWRRRTKAGELFVTPPSASHGLDDSHLDVAREVPERSSRETESDEAAVGCLRAFASGDPSGESRGWGVGDEAGLQVGSEAMGAVRSRPTRTRRSPELLQMPPTMRGSDRAWQERMPLDGLLEVDAESGEDETVARGKKVRGTASETAVAKLSTTASETSMGTSRGARAGSKSHAEVPDEPSTSGKAHGRSFRGAGGAGGTRQ